MTSPTAWTHSSGTPSGMLAASHLFSTWCKAHGYGVLGRLACGLGSKEWGSLNFLFGVLLFDIKEPNCFCLLQPA